MRSECNIFFLAKIISFFTMTTLIINSSLKKASLVKNISICSHKQQQKICYCLHIVVAEQSTMKINFA